jgi:anti-sigma factor RsiW
MTDGLPDDLPPEWLAAYADGELGPGDRARVDVWLADHPEARDLLDEQESLGPKNVEFWQAVRPPEPTRRQWAAARRAVHGRARMPAARRWLPWVGSLALAATATAATVFFALPPVNPTTPPVPAVASPPRDVDDEPYAMASADEVRIISLPEEAAHLLVVGEHPLGGQAVVLAKADEVEFLGIGTDLAGRFPDVPTDVAPDDAPMLWAPRDP